MSVLDPLLNIVRLVVFALWGATWITLAALAALVTLDGSVPLMFARRFWAPFHWRLLGASFTIEPLPDIDWSRPHIFVMNHQSALDIPCAFAALPVNIRFVAKHILKWVPFLGWYMLMTGMIFINRSHRREALHSLQLAGERIRAGANILVYPEGTRSPDGLIHPFKKGPFVLALAAQVPIVPVAIEGSGQAVPTGKPLHMRSHPIRLKVGTPISTAGRAPRERDALLREVREALIQLHRDIGGAGGIAQEVAHPSPDDFPHDSEPSDPSSTARSAG